MLVSEQYPVCGKVGEPAVAGLGVECGPVLRGTLEHCRVEPVLVNFIDLCQEFPRPVDCLVLEIVPEAPVSEHLKHRVVVGVMPYLLKVVVFPADPQALLAVRGAREWCWAIAEEPVLELVHSGVCEH